VGRPVISQELEFHDVAALLALADSPGRPNGDSPFSDQSRLLLEHGDPSQLIVVSDGDGEHLSAFVQLSAANNSWTLDVVRSVERNGRRPAEDPADRLDELVRTALDALVGRGAAPTDVTWWTTEPSELPRRFGFTLDRELLQMHRPLPTGRSADIETRPFIVGHDEEAFLEVNNRAFAQHHEQGGWTMAALQLRLDEPWFDADGFRLHEREGRLAGFCWTKRHDSNLGEIYVIAVDPDFAGHRLGTQLTLAGLDHLEGLGITEALLYVDASNKGAVTMYERLGFATRMTNQAHVRHLISEERR
jgi:mycothiol synthase